MNSGLINIENLLEFFLGHFVDRLPVLEDVVKAPVPHDAPNHGFADVSECLDRVSDVKEELLGVFPAELDDPLHVDDVQIAREHEGFPLHLRPLFILRPNAGANGSETKGLRILLCRVHLGNRVDSKRDLKVNAWHGRVGIFAEPEDYPPVAGWNSIHGGVN